MVSLTEMEKKAVLVIFKDFTAYYNANSISKVLGMSRVGALKMLRKMEKGGLVSSQPIGKSIVYKLKLDDDYVRKLVAFLLADEANGFRRWKEEFREMFKEGCIVMLFGSAIANYEKARDIDILIAAPKGSMQKIGKAIESRREILPKKLHAIKLTRRELESNIKRKSPTILDIIRKGVILHGQDTYVEVMKIVTGA